MTFVRKQDVGGLQIAVNQTKLVSMSEAAGNFHYDPRCRLVERHASNRRPWMVVSPLVPFVAGLFRDRF